MSETLAAPSPRVRGEPPGNSIIFGVTVAYENSVAILTCPAKYTLLKCNTLRSQAKGGLTPAFY